jgi:hypothetical protein
VPFQDGNEKNKMAPVEITDVTLSDVDAKQLWRRNIEAPKPKSQQDDYAFTLVGWVIGQSSPAVVVEVMHKETAIQRAPIDVKRPDVVAAFPSVLSAERSGFHTTVTLPETGESELLVRAVLRDESRVPLGVIGVRQRGSGEEGTQGSNRASTSEFTGESLRARKPQGDKDAAAVERGAVIEERPAEPRKRRSDARRKHKR